MAKTTRKAGKTVATTKTAKTVKTVKTAATTKTAKTAKTVSRSAKKNVGDVLGISRARVPKDVPRATTARGGRPKGIEISKTATRRAPKRAGVVGGVRGRGR